MSMCISIAQARTRWAPRFCPVQLSRDFARVRSLSLWWCAVRILISLAQPSRDFWCVRAVRSPSLWCGANFDIACTALSWLLACQIALVVARCEFWYRLRSPLMTFGVSEQSDRPCCGFVRILISFAQPSRDFWRVRSLSLWRGANFDIARALVWLKSCTGPYQKILWRPCWHSRRGPCMIFRRSLREDLAEIVMKSFLQGPCMIPCRSLIEDLVEILVRSLGRFLYQDLVTSCNIPSSSSVFFKWRSCEILLGVLAWSSWSGFYNSLWEDLVEICRDPDEILWEVLAVHDLVKVLVRRCCEDPGEIPKKVLAWSCTGFYEKILWRSCWIPPQEALHYLADVCIGACMWVWATHRKFLYKDLLRSSI